MNQLLQLYKKSYSGFSKDIWLLSLITLINKSGTMVMLFMSIYLSKELSYDFNEIGMVMACFGIGSFFGSFIGGILTDLIGYYKVMFLSLILSGLGFITLIFISNFWLLCIVVTLTTLFGDSFRPANYVAIRAYSLPENQTRSMAVIRLAINLGFTMGPAIGGLLAQSLGYHWVFILDGSTCIIAGFSFLLLMKDKPLNKPSKKNRSKTNYSDIFKNKVYLKFLLYSFFVSTAFFQVFSILPVYLEEQNAYTEAMIGLLLGLNGFLIILIEMPLVYSLENKYPLLKTISFGCLFMSLSYLLLGFNLSLIIIPIIFMSLATLGEMLNFPFASSWALNQSNDHNAGAYMSMFSMCFAASHIFAPILGYTLVEKYNYQFMWYFMSFICFIAFFGIYRLSTSKS